MRVSNQAVPIESELQQAKVIKSVIRNPMSNLNPIIRKLVNTVTLSRSSTTEQAEFS